MTESTAAALFWGGLLVAAYTHAGYVLVLAALRRWRRAPPVPHPAPPPSVSVIIPAHDEAAVIGETLSSVLSLDYPSSRLEVLVASDGSRDRTNDIVRSFADRGVRLLAFETRRGKPSVINDAVKAAASETFCLCDANVSPRPDALRYLVEPLGDRGVGAVSADVRLRSGASDFGRGEALYYRYERRVQQLESDVGSVMGVDGGLYVIRASCFRPLAVDTILDDFTVSMSVIEQGRRIRFAPRAVADETGTPTALQEYRRRVRVAAGAVQALRRGVWPPVSRPVELWQFVSHKLLRWLGPVVLIGVLLTNARLWASGPLYRAALVTQLAFYLLAMAGLASRWARQTRLASGPFYIVLGHAAMLAGAVRGLCGRQPVTWQRSDRDRG